MILSPGPPSDRDGEQHCYAPRRSRQNIFIRKARNFPLLTKFYDRHKETIQTLSLEEEEAFPRNVI